MPRRVKREGWAPMGDKLRKVTLAVFLGGLAAVLVAPPAGASREPHPTTTTTEPSYVPTYGQNPHPELPPEPDPYAGSPGVAPTIVPVDLPAVGTDPGAGLAVGAGLVILARRRRTDTAST